LASNIRFGKRFFKLAGNAEITEFDIALFVQKNIRGFNV
jgi:hypothetical protein